jgi:uncharacterized protein (DUF362 family)
MRSPVQLFILKAVFLWNKRCPIYFKNKEIPMKTISRRELLRRTAMGLGAVALGDLLAACSPITKTPAITPTNMPSSAVPAAATRAPTAAATASAATQAAAAPVQAVTSTAYSIADLAVARGGDDPEILVRKAIAALGGMEHYVPKGANVVIKPNMCIPAPFTQGATTNPIVVAALVKMAFEAGAKTVKVLDFPFGGPSLRVYDVCGIGTKVKEAGGEMEPIATFKFVKTDIPKAVSMKKADIYQTILKADVLINVPVAKNHSEAMYTMGLKNMMGAVSDRPGMHVYLNQAIADLNTIVHPQLTVIDAVRIMMRGGPQGGREEYLKKIDTIVASADVVAADTYALSFFNATLDMVPYIKLAERLGVGRTDLNNLKIEEIAVG